MATTIAPAITKERIYEMRKEITDLKALLESHFGSAGDSHVVGTLDHPGFMSKELYAKLLGFQAQIDAARRTIEANDVPEHLMLYWYGDVNKIPAGYKLCTGSNNTLNLSSLYIKPCVTDAAAGHIGGTDKLSEIPLPRHRHAFPNYVDCEVWKELAWAIEGNANTKRKAVGNLRGSECSKSATTYPLYYDDTTASTGSSSLPSIKVTPSYVALHVIRRDTNPVIYTSEGIGTVRINLNSVIPTGWLEMNGDWVDAEYYKALHRYAASNGLVISSAQWTSTYNSSGTVPYFAYDATNKLLRLPLMRGMLKLRGLDAAPNSPAQAKGKHFHGMGPMWNNNGQWGRLAYSVSEYPSGSTGWYWNGKGGHSTYNYPPDAGDIITSQEFTVGTTGNGEVCDSMNVNLIIRAFHEEAASLIDSTAAAMDMGFEDEAAVLTEIEDIITTPVNGIQSLSNSDPNGWRIEPGGRLFTWGEYEVISTGTIFIPFTVGFTSEIYNISVKNVSSGYTNVSIVNFDKNKLDGFYIHTTNADIGSKISYSAFGV